MAKKPLTNGADRRAAGLRVPREEQRIGLCHAAAAVLNGLRTTCLLHQNVGRVQAPVLTLDSPGNPSH